MCIIKKIKNKRWVLILLETAFLFISSHALAEVVTVRVVGPYSSDPGQWTNQNGSAWSGELGDQSDATYVRTSGDRRVLYGDVQPANLPSGSVVNSVMVYIRASQTTGNEDVEYGVRCWEPGEGWVNNRCARVTPGTGWTEYSCTWTQNPCTGRQWTLSEVNQLIGYLRTRANGWWQGEMRVSEMWFDVDYEPPYLVVDTNYAVVNGDYEIIAYAQFSGDANSNSSTDFEICTDSACSTPQLICSGVTGTSPRSCVMSGLQPGTTYWIRITHSDPDGVSGTNPEIIGPYTTTHYSLTVGTTTGTSDSDTQITVQTTFTGDNNSNSSTDFELCTDSTCSTASLVCSGVTGSSPRECVFSGLSQNTSYWVRVTHSDPDGVNGTSPHIAGPFTTTNRRVIPLTASATVNSTVQITVSAPFNGDENLNSATSFERCTDSTCSSPVVVCSGVSGTSPRTCVDSSLIPDTDYWYRITFEDPDGVNASSAPNPQIVGPYRTLPDTAPPSFGGVLLVEDTGAGGEVKIEFDAATDESPPIRYNIYYAIADLWDDANWANNQVLYDAPTQPGDVYALKTFLSGLENGEEYVIGVRAEDVAGNEESNSITLTVIPYKRKMDHVGYHMVADGLMPQAGNNTPSAVFGDDVGGRLSVYIWQSSGLGFNPPFRGQYVVPSIIEPGKAYWVYNWQAGNTLDDDKGSHNTNAQTVVQISPGWNMISNPYQKNIKLADVIVTKLNSPGAGDYTFDQAVANGWLVGAIYWWTGSGYTWRAYNDLPPAKLVPWVGYWIYQADDTVQLELKFNKPKGRK